MVTETDRFIRAPEVARMLGISKASLYAWRKSGYFLPARSLGPSAIGWKLSEVERWIEGRGHVQGG